MRNALLFLPGCACIEKFAISFFPGKAAMIVGRVRRNLARHVFSAPFLSLYPRSTCISSLVLLFFFTALLVITPRNKRKTLADKSAPIKGNPFYYMQSRTLIQGCHELFREETLKGTCSCSNAMIVREGEGRPTYF